MAFTENSKPRPSSLSFHIRDVHLSIINSLRRVMLSDIPNVGIRFDPYNETDHDVNISVNTGCLHNEFLSHRMSLIPICMHPNAISGFEKARSHKFVIKKKNTSNVIVNVTTDDIQVYDHEDNLVTDHGFFPKDYITGDPILITKLKPNLFDKENGDEVQLEAFASIGTAANNAGWSPVSTATFRNVVDEEAANAAFEAKTAGADAAKRKELRERFDVLEKYQYFQKNVFGEPNHFVFTVESECAMPPAFIVFRAFQILGEKVAKVKASVLENNTDHAQVSMAGNVYQVQLLGETHTIGNLIQAQLYDHYVRGEAKKTLEYVGYICPHPLEKRIVIKFKFAEGVVATEDEFRGWLGKAIDEISTKLRALGVEWIERAELSADEFVDVQTWGISEIA